MSFSPDELERYARHIVMHDIGGAGQQKLAAARVLVIGAGGLGSPALLYLAAAGVGTIGIVDDDDVALSNLQRQVLHMTKDIGRPKVETAAEAIGRLNPHVSVVRHGLRLDDTNAASIIRDYDLVVDGSDSFETRRIVSDACFHERKPLVVGMLGVFDAMLTTLRPFESGHDGRPNPTWHCLFPEPPPPGTVPSCSEAGVLGALAGMVGSMMAVEAVREIVGFGEGLTGRLLHIDARSMRFAETRYDWDDTNPLNGRPSAGASAGQT